MAGKIPVDTTANFISGLIMDLVTLQNRLMESEERVYNYVYGQIWDNLRPVIAVEDVLQEIWTAAFQRAADLREDMPNAFDRWIITIAKRKVIDALRHATAKRRGDPNVPLSPLETSFLTLADHIAGKQPTPSRVISAHESIAALRIALTELSDDHRQVITLHHLEGRSHEEIGKIMNRTTDAINGLMYRALKELRNEMGRASRYFSDAPDSVHLSKSDLDLKSGS